MDRARRPLLAIALVLCLVTAGCSSFFGIEEPNLEPKTTTLSGELAPGLSATGFTDRGELTRAHARILQDESYTFHKRIVERNRNGSVRGRLVQTTRLKENSSRAVHRAVRNGSLVPGEGDDLLLRTWSNTTMTVFAQTRSGNTSYNLSQNERALARAQGPTNRDRLYALFTAMNVTHVERVETKPSGTPTYRVVADDLVHPVTLTGVNDFDSVENASLVAVIDTWGLIHRYRFEATGTVDGERVHRTESVEITNIGETSVERPSWVSGALEATRQDNSTRT